MGPDVCKIEIYQYLELALQEKESIRIFTIIIVHLFSNASADNIGELLGIDINLSRFDPWGGSEQL